MKETLRQTLLQQRLTLSSALVESYSQSLMKQIIALPAFQQAKVIGLYSPIKNEPDLTPLIQKNKLVLLPKVVGDSLIYGQWKQGDTLIKSPLNIFEPKTNEDDSHLLDLVIIPGVAFDRLGNRLGFGKGYFDRYLATHRPPLVIGVCYPFQLQKQLEVTQEDMKVDLVLVA
jgi:5-formyltetrahydrofolate cyclo-ligase